MKRSQVDSETVVLPDGQSLSGAILEIRDWLTQLADACARERDRQRRRSKELRADHARLVSIVGKLSRQMAEQRTATHINVETLSPTDTDWDAINKSVSATIEHTIKDTIQSLASSIDCEALLSAKPK